MNLKVLSGGQAGTDRAPLGWTTEDGPASWLADFAPRPRPLETRAAGLPPLEVRPLRLDDEALEMPSDVAPGSPRIRP